MPWSHRISRLVGVIDNRCDLDANIQDLVDINIERLIAYRWRRGSTEKGEDQFLQVCRRSGREADLLLLLPSDEHDDDRLLLTEPRHR